jgi:tripartite-type tricarboxylate transporter receptor subunit TctC
VDHIAADTPGVSNPLRGKPGDRSASPHTEKETSKVKAGIIARMCAAIVFGACAMGAHANTWPDKPIKLILPSGPGTPIDVLARIISSQVEARIGQPMIVENRPGADGSIAANAVAHAQPDGYTLLLGNAGIFTIIPSYDKYVSYDPFKQFAPIAQLVTATLVVDADPALRLKSLRDLVALSKSHPGKYNYASSTGRSGIAYLFGEQFKELSGADLTWVGYSQDSAALNDVIAGRIAMYIDAVGTSLPHYKAGKLDILAVMGDHRSPLLPKVPTVQESGFKGVGGQAWVGLLAPAGTPAQAVSKLNRAMQEILARADVRENLVFNGFEPAYSTPDQLEALMHSDTERWKSLIARLHLQRK